MHEEGGEGTKETRRCRRGLGNKRSEDDKYEGEKEKDILDLPALSTSFGRYSYQEGGVNLEN